MVFFFIYNSKVAYKIEGCAPNLAKIGNLFHNFLISKKYNKIGIFNEDPKCVLKISAAIETKKSEPIKFLGKIGENGPTF